ncbi:glycoside hydrolase family 3 [Desulfovibrio sp. OttesenSCG-928-O18]|nr:glycoside hydrolase family 3 [Desulfovibrio sp. OttesenSCG-928-O18]
MRKFLLLLGFVAFFSHAGPAFAAERAGGFPATLSLDAMIGQMVMVGFRGDGTAETPELRAVLADIRAGRIGGVIFFDRDWQSKKRGRNIVSTAQTAKLTARLQREAAIPLFIAVDQEGGRVQRLRPDHGFAATPKPEDMGKNAPQATFETAFALGRALRELGINVNFAPVADVAVNPAGPAIGALGRAFSGDPAAVAAHSAAFATGLGKARVASSYKHFPGHGSSVADSHHNLTDITATWSEAELLPYKNPPRDIPLMMMTGHLMHKTLDPVFPASLSRAITTGLLREKLGWQGVVVTDDLEMDAIDLYYPMEERIRLAIEAGVDIILFGNNLKHHPEQGRRVHAVIKNLVASGKVSPERIAASWARIRALKMQVTDPR